jgi:aminoglycoside phosphotransferase (APT) family kinase protein
MAKPWEPEWEVDEEALRALLAEHAPELEPAGLRRVAAGWDNTVWELDSAGAAVVVRVARRRVAVPLLEHELRWLPALAAQLPVAVSAPRWGVAGLPSPPHAFAAYPRLDGQSGAELLSAEVPARMAHALGHSLGKALARLHSLPVPPPEEGPPGDPCGKSDVPATHARLVQARPRLLQSVPRALLDDCLALVHELVSSRPRPWSHPCWVHGDLDHRHLLFHDSGELAGIIDWGDLHVGDPALDLGVWWSMLPLAARHSFQTAYGPVDAHTWRRARLRVVVHQLHVLDWSSQTQKPAVAEAARRALGQALRG